jgi:hypothetical protein
MSTSELEEGCRSSTASGSKSEKKSNSLDVPWDYKLKNQPQQ